MDKGIILGLSARQQQYLEELKSKILQSAKINNIADIASIVTAKSEGELKNIVENG